MSKTNYRSLATLAGITALALSGSLACSKSSPKSNPAVNPAPQEVPVEKPAEVVPAPNTGNGFDLNPNVALEITQDVGGADGEVVLRKYTITDGEKSVTTSFKNSGSPYGNANLFNDGVEYWIGDQCRNAGCTEVVALVARISDGQTKTNAVLFRLTDEGKYNVVCAQKDVTYESQEQAYEPLVKLCNLAENEVVPVPGDDVAQN